MQKREARLAELANIIVRRFYGNDVCINGLGLCNRKSKHKAILSYLTSLDYARFAFENIAVQALIVSSEIFEALNQKYLNRFSYIISEQPEEDFYSLHELLFKRTSFYENDDIRPVIKQGCEIHPTVIIEDNVVIGERVEIGAYTVISKGSIIGNDCHIGRLSVIGSQGFQAIRCKNGRMHNVTHVGGCRIGDNVWVGDNVTICNALFEGEVVVGDNSLIDNHTQVAHNCYIGDNNVLTAGVILLGSSILKNNCWLAPGAMVMNRVTIENNGFVGVNSVANKDVKQGKTVFGNPAIELEEFVKTKYAINKIINNKQK